MILKTFTAALLLATTLLLFTACDSKTDTNTTNDQNPAARTTEKSSAAGDGDITANAQGSGTTTSDSGVATASNEDSGNSTEDTRDNSNDNAAVQDNSGRGYDNTATAPTVTLTSLKLTINKTSLNKDENTTVKVMASYSDSSTKDVTDSVEWIVTPSDAVKVTSTTLTALQDKATTVKAKLNSVASEAVSLNITWTVNGHTLPPDPDKATNDSTLLGIDANGNGVRDDVERWIYQTYDNPIERGIFMQSARAYNMVIVDPSNAHETTKYIDDSSSCMGYYKYWRVLYKNKNETFYLDRYRSLVKEIRPIQFNTIKRHMAYERFNAEFNGEVFGAPPISKDKCEFDENGILKALK